jgi:4-amino-4-deoxy-L-arabinose transferase-like glycosyltransferase
MTENKVTLSKYDLAFISVFVFAVAIRLYFFYTTQNQALWWDGAEYMNMAKNFAGVYNAEWWPGRPILMPLLWAGMLKLGLGEIALKFLVTIFSLAGILFTYLTIKNMYDKRTAIVTTALLSAFWLHLFYSARMLVDVPSLTMWTMIIYFFWKALDTKNWKYYALTGVFITLGTLIRFPTIIIGALILIYLIATERHKFIFDKNIWVMAGGSLAIMAPYFVWATLKFGSPLYQILFGSGAAGQTFGLPSLIAYLRIFPVYFTTAGIILFVIGLYMFVDTILGVDLLNKMSEENKLLRSNFLILLWLLIPLIYFSTQSRVEERYIIFIFPAAFLIITKGIFYIETLLKRVQINLASVVTVILIIAIVILQLSAANVSITNSVNSYAPVKAVGIWINENTPDNSVIYTMSVPQIEYYAERKTLSYGGTAEDFDKIISAGGNSYFMISAFEGHPNWVADYLSSNTNLELLQTYTDENQKPVLMLYKIKT